MRTVEIKGGTARLREADEMKVRQKRAIECATVEAFPALEKIEDLKAQLGKDDLGPQDIPNAGLTGSDWKVFRELQDATIVAHLVDWSLDAPVPTTDTIVDMEDVDLYEELANLCGEIDGGRSVGVDFNPLDPTSPEFEASPTAPSAD